MPVRLTYSICLVILTALYVSAADKPNIIVIVADDLGWADVGYHGSAIKTPHIDQLVKAGVELDQFYVAPMCTPTRAALLTGRYWSRYGNTAPSNERVLPYDTLTLPKALKTLGYSTFMTGKWHLGSSPAWGPNKFGFDFSHGSLAGGVTAWTHLYKHGEYTKTWHRNGELIDEEGHVTDLITAEAITCITKKHDSPFFLYVPFTAVHTPFDEPEKWLSSAAHIDEGRRQYAAAVQHMDNGIGDMVTALKQKKLYNNTIIVFFSDNGGTKGDDSRRYPDTKPTTKVNGLNSPLRGWKTEVYEGGIRVPAFVSWSGRLHPFKMTDMMHVVDVMPTLLGFAGFEADHNLKWDGGDQGLNLQGAVEEKRMSFYCKGVRGRSSAYRLSDWKLITHGASKTELYNIANDPSEKTDLAREHPERVEQLMTLLKADQAKDDDAVPDRRND